MTSAVSTSQARASQARANQVRAPLDLSTLLIGFIESIA
jgi:hypothetical protein